MLRDTAYEQIEIESHSMLAFWRASNHDKGVVFYLRLSPFFRRCGFEHDEIG